MTEEEFRVIEQNRARAAALDAREPGDGVLSLDDPIPRPNPRRGRMNKLEARFEAEEIIPRVRIGEILWYGFEAIKIRLADGAWYTPDFVIQDSYGLISLIEVKGFWREAARVRVKVAADKVPWFIRAVTRDRKTGEWIYETIGGRV
jgi:hypothetical protein